MKGRFFAFVAGLLFLAGGSTTLAAQNTITLEGVVKTETGPLSGAQIMVVNVATQETARALSRANGEFRVLGLFAGNYAVTVRAIGYKPLSETVQLVIGQRARLEFLMEKGVAELAAQTITGDKVKQVEVQRLTVSAPVLKDEIENLPLNSRGVMNLASIAPGIKTYAPQSGRALPTGGAAPDLRFINLYMDGVEMKSLYNGNLVGLPQTGSPLPQDALEQMRVFLNPYDAEYARTGSYVISAESRRGTNKWEGSGFGFFQNQNLVTQNAFQTRVPDYSRNQFGLNIRGPLEKDKLFLAASYEYVQTNNFIDVNPTSNVTGTDPWAAYRGSFSSPNNNQLLFTRLTYVQDPQNTWDLMASARLMTGASNFGGTATANAGIDQNYHIYTGQLRERYLGKSGNFVNEASAQLVIWGHDEEPVQAGPQKSYPGAVFGTSGFPLILKETHIRLIDRASWTLDSKWGTHVVKAGVELASIAASQTYPINQNGTFTFPTDTSKLPSSASIAVGFTDPNSISDSYAAATAYTTGVYLNDEWTIKPNFTLNIGVRHDAEFNTMDNTYHTPWADDPTLQSISTLAPYLSTGNRPNQLGNVSPRLSFSWDPLENNKTFVRGGYGIMYDRVTSFIGFQERRNSTWRTYNFTNPGTTDPAVLRAQVIAGKSGSPAPILINHDMKTPKNTEWSFGIGHQATPEFGINVDYVVQNMTNLYNQWNPNYLDKSVTPNARHLTSKYGDIILWDDFGKAYYSAFMLQMTYQKNKTRLNFAYTLGWYEGNFDTSGLPVYTFPQLYDMQRTSGDERHRFVLSEVSPIWGGFMFSSITTVASPRPYVVTDGRDQNLNNVFSDDYPGGGIVNGTVVTGIRTAMPSMKWDNWYRTVDIRLSRPLYTVNGTKISFSAEIFNLFNWSNNQSYRGTQNTTAGVALANYGFVSAAYAARQAQVGLRAEW